MGPTITPTFTHSVGTAAQRQELVNTVEFMTSTYMPEFAWSTVNLQIHLTRAAGRGTGEGHIAAQVGVDHSTGERYINLRAPVTISLTVGGRGEFNMERTQLALIHETLHLLQHASGAMCFMGRRQAWNATKGAALTHRVHAEHRGTFTTDAPTEFTGGEKTIIRRPQVQGDRRTYCRMPSERQAFRLTSTVAETMGMPQVARQARVFARQMMTMGAEPKQAQAGKQGGRWQVTMTGRDGKTRTVKF